MFRILRAEMAMLPTPLRHLTVKFSKNSSHRKSGLKSCLEIY